MLDEADKPAGRPKGFPLQATAEITQQVNARQAGWAKPGTRLKTYSKKSGEQVYAFVYNKHKRSTWWIQVDYKGKTYIPWAWLTLDSGDNLKDLPAC